QAIPRLRDATEPSRAGGAPHRPLRRLRLRAGRALGRPAGEGRRRAGSAPPSLVPPHGRAGPAGPARRAAADRVGLRHSLAPPHSCAAVSNTAPAKSALAVVFHLVHAGMMAELEA